MRRRLAAPLVVLAFGCSIVDPGDRAELEQKIESMPPAEVSMLTRMAMNAKAFDWFRNRPKADQVAKLFCRFQAGGQWTDWAEQEETFLVHDMLGCLIEDTFDIPVTALLCVERFVLVQTQLKLTELMGSVPESGTPNVECKHEWDPRYAPDMLPVKVTDPNAITTGDIIDAMIALPAPPPGWAFPELVPLLCPLGAGPGWGCPPKPGDTTGGQPNTSPGGQPGDHP